MHSQATFDVYEIDRDYPPRCVDSVTAPYNVAQQRAQQKALFHGQSGPVEIRRRLMAHRLLP